MGTQWKQPTLQTLCFDNSCNALHSLSIKKGNRSHRDEAAVAPYTRHRGVGCEGILSTDSTLAIASAIADAAGDHIF
jgi:hypothetical protein